MRATVYSKTGGPDVLQLVERPVREPEAGEVRVRVQVSGVNPTDWKAHRGAHEGEELPFPEVVPNQDGAGTIDAVGTGVPADRVGESVWLWEAAWKRADGTAQEFVVLPGSQAVRLPDRVSFDVGASLGIPALTAHRCLTVSDLGPRRLEAGALTGQTVLVPGGAGAFGHAAIQLARCAYARVISTLSSDQNACSRSEKTPGYRSTVSRSSRRPTPMPRSKAAQSARSSSTSTDAQVHVALWAQSPITPPIVRSLPWRA